jgi:hypothetical protein
VQAAERAALPAERTVSRFRHDAAMPTVQLIVRERTGGVRDLEAVPAEGQEPADFWGKDTEALPVGSQDLVDLAVALREYGYRPMDLGLVDFTFSPVPEARPLIDQLLTRLRTDDREGVRAFMASVMPHYYVENVELRDSGPQNGRVTLVQDGLVRTTSEYQLSKIPDILREALGFARSTGYTG